MKTNKRAWPVWSWAAVLVWAGVIFVFSAQVGASSGSMSGSVTLRLAALWPDWSALSASEQELRLSLMHLLVRKGAHVTEFAVFGGLLMNAWTRQQRCAGARQAALAALCGLVYAATDEFHQLFVPERTAALRDVCIDFGGVALGVCVVWAIYRLCGRRKGNL